MIVSKQLAKIY